MLDIIAVVVRRRRLIIGMTVIVAVCTLLFLLSTMFLPVSSTWNLMPNKYMPTVKILLQDSSASSSLSSILNQSGIGTLTNLMGVTGTSISVTNSALAQALLGSNSLLDGVATKFDFAKRYNITKLPKTSARTKVQNGMKVTFDAVSGILTVGYEDIDPVFATSVVNDITDRLQTTFKSLTMDKVTTKREYLEKAIESAQKSVSDESQALVAFQKQHGIYDISSQTQANINAVASLQGQLRARQIELDVQRKYYPETDSRIVMLKNEIDQYQAQIDQLSGGGGVTPSNTVPLSQMAQLTLQYTSIERDITVQQAILGTLKQQYETAKFEEMDTSQTFQVIEQAEVPEVRSGPHRSLVAIIITFAALLLSIVVAFIVEYFAKARRQPEGAVKLQEIKASLTLRRRKRPE